MSCLNSNSLKETLIKSPHPIEQCEPVYEMTPGWKDNTVGIREFGKLPANAQ
ncbi:MAG: adenylosuccinate synthetase, partial [Burkholderiales bacterium]